jgi:hypothetical protein
MPAILVSFQQAIYLQYVPAKKKCLHAKKVLSLQKKHSPAIFLGGHNFSP